MLIIIIIMMKIIIWNRFNRLESLLRSPPRWMEINEITNLLKLVWRKWDGGEGEKIRLNEKKENFFFLKGRFLFKILLLFFNIMTSWINLFYFVSFVYFVDFLPLFFFWKFFGNERMPSKFQQIWFVKNVRKEFFLRGEKVRRGE